ncbi:MAG: transporter [Pseudomonadota bacterium]|nr:transporter [Pseudomonadota bacterium]
MAGRALTATLPLDFVRGPKPRTGIGDVELGVKYRFFADEKAGVQVSIFPRVILPNSGRTYGSGRTGMLLPVWGQKDIGKWSLFGGGGYAINPGAGNRGYWQTGVAPTRAVSDRLSVGAEATYHGRDVDDATPVATLGIGGIWKIRGPFSLLASAGPSFAGRHGERYHGYLALGLNF